MKIFKYVLMFILIASTMALAGCGGDKFAGKWYALDEESSQIYMLDITKNGENYIIKQNIVSYKPEYKQVGTETVEREEFAGWFMDKVKRQYQVPVYDATFNLKVENVNQITEVENKGQLGEYTYIEKDGTLQGKGHDPRGSFSSRNIFTYSKDIKKDVAKKLQPSVIALYNEVKAGKVAISIGNGIKDFIIKDLKFNEELPQEMK